MNLAGYKPLLDLIYIFFKEVVGVICVIFQILFLNFVYCVNSVFNSTKHLMNRWNYFTCNIVTGAALIISIYFYIGDTYYCNMSVVA